MVEKGSKWKRETHEREERERDLTSLLERRLFLTFCWIDSQGRDL